MPVPVAAPDGISFSRVTTVENGSMAVTADGAVYSWGWNQTGVLGNGVDMTNVPVRVLLPTDQTFVDVAADGTSVAALTADGTTFTWGQNNRGQLGDGTTTDRLEPVQVLMPDGVTVSQVSVGTSVMAAVGSDGLTYTWGSNFSYQLGTGDTSTAFSALPVVVAHDVVVTSVAFGGVVGPDLAQDGGTWSVTTPAGVCGPVDVVVTATRYGQPLTQQFPAGFTFGTPATITEQPASLTLPTGATEATVTTAAAGDATPDLRWQQSTDGATWTDVPGATDPTLHATVGATTSFRAVATNCFGSVTSDIATITVPPAGDGPDGSAAGTDPSSPLAVTGASPAPVLAIALGALAVGAAALVVSGRRRRDPARPTRP